MARLTRVLVMAKATTDQQQEFQRLVHYGHTWRGTGMFTSWIRLDWGIIDNPVLSVMAQALTGYRMRTSNDHCSDRKSVVLGKSVSVCVDIGVRRTLKKK